MIAQAAARAWWHAVGGPLERPVRQRAELLRLARVEGKPKNPRRLSAGWGVGLSLRPARVQLQQPGLSRAARDGGGARPRLAAGMAEETANSAAGARVCAATPANGGGVPEHDPPMPNVRANRPAEASAVSPVRDDAPCAADRAYGACRSWSGGSARG